MPWIHFFCSEQKYLFRREESNTNVFRQLTEYCQQPLSTKNDCIIGNCSLFHNVVDIGKPLFISLETPSMHRDVCKRYVRNTGRSFLYSRKYQKVQ